MLATVTIRQEGLPLVRASIVLKCQALEFNRSRRCPLFL
jgi:hypothetical protein